jgi:Phage integrase, N-terminal SAM-like domain
MLYPLSYGGGVHPDLGKRTRRRGRDSENVRKQKSTRRLPAARPISESRAYLEALRNTRLRAALTVYQYAAKFQSFLSWVGSCPLAEVNSDEIEAWLSRLLGATNSSARTTRSASTDCIASRAASRSWDPWWLDPWHDAVSRHHQNHRFEAWEGT